MSTIIDAMDGKNLAVIGPPGTGKSQTITNLITASISNGKSVLFVAQKKAALEVVEKRLANIGLGDFVLVMGGNLKKENIMDSIKKRMDLEDVSYPYNLDEQLENLKKHTNKLNKYKRFSEKKICNLNFNYHDIVFKYRSTETDDFPKNINNFKDAKEITSSMFKEILEDLISYKNSAKKILNDYGQYEKHPLSYIQKKLTVFEVESLTDNLLELKEIVSSISEIEKELCLDFSIDNFNNEDLRILSEIDYTLSPKAKSAKIEKLLFTKFNKINFLKEFEEYNENLNNLREGNTFLESKITDIKNESKLLKNLKLINKRINALNEYEVIKKTPQEIIHFQEKIISQNLEYSRNKYFIENILTIVSSNDVHKFDYSKLKINKLKNAVSIVVKAFLELNEKTFNGCREVDIDRDHFLLNKDKIINELMPVIAKCEKECKEIKDLRGDLENIISLSFREDFYEIRKSGQYLMSLRWYDYFEKHRDKYRNSIELFQTYSKSQNLPNVKEIGSILYRVSLYMEKQLNVFKDDRLNENLGKIWKKEDTEFSSLNAYFNFLYEINSIEDFDTREFFYENIAKLNANSLKESKKFIQKIVNEIPDFSMENSLLLGDENIYSLYDFKEKFELISSEVNSIIDIGSEINFKKFDNSEGFLFSDLENLIDILSIKTKIRMGKNFDLLEEYFFSKDDEIKNSKNIYDISDDFRSVVINTYSFYQDCKNLFNKISESNFDKLDLITKVKKKVFSQGFIKTLDRINISINELNDVASQQKSIEDKISILLERNISDEFLSNEDKLKWIKGILKNIEDNDLSDWLNFIKLREKFHLKGLQDFLGYYDEDKKLKKIDKHFEHYLYRSIAKEFYSDPENKEIVDYTGSVLDKERFKLDEVNNQIKKLNVDKIKSKLLANPISEGKSARLVPDKTDNTLLLHYKNLKSGSGKLSLRKIILNANRAIRDYKPCWMMDPKSVAQNLPKVNQLFDFVVIDEASQMLPQDAIGSILRGKQVIIVGDNMQLPPTNFFSTNSKNDDDDEDDDLESILDQALISFNPKRELNWHYRSEHESLIAYSNQEFYNNDLTIFPSPKGPSLDLGVSYEYVQDAIYNKGINPIEADIVVERAIEHMQKNKNISLMLVALNKAQAELIEQKYKTRIVNEYIQECFEYEEKWKSTVEPFEVKNLETVQGDERDSVIISTVYGKEKDSEVVMQRFGPISGQNGHRRLNVLYTRAKKNVRVISSLRPNDIRVNSGSTRGVKAFAGYLEYASTGKLESGTYTGKEADSPFEVSVKDVLESKGYEVECQVGVAGYRIDLGVKHPNWPSGFLAGIECDGATYHSARSARDRDIARQKVLEGKGWNIHRIWSTDWFENPHKATENMINKLEEWMN
jgi:superfamily I DNA and/or RNA helicase/very-short-patch-repair endonuclease